jgi:hypothetical protein
MARSREGSRHQLRVNDIIDLEISPSIAVKARTVGLYRELAIIMNKFVYFYS